MGSIFTNTPAILDFEEGNLNDYDGTFVGGTGVNTCVSSPVKYGAYAHETKITSGVSSDYAYGRKDVTWPSDKAGHLRFFMCVTAVGTYSGYGLITAGIISVAQWYMQLVLNPATLSLRFQARDSVNLVYTGLSFSISLSVWYEIEIKYDISGTNAVAELFKDGVSLGIWQGTGVPASTPEYIRTEARSAVADATNYATIAWDQIQAEDSRIGHIAGVGDTFGLSDVKLTPLPSGSQVDLPAGRVVSFRERTKTAELSGDDSLQAVVSFADVVEWELEAGGISLEAYALMSGRTVVTSGSTPNEEASLPGEAAQAFPYFKMYGRSLGDGSDDVHVKLLKCKVSGGLEGSFQDGQFFVKRCRGIAVDNGTTGIWEIVQHETAMGLPET